MLVSRIVEMSLKQLGILAAGESVQGDELADSLITLEGLLAQWATQKLYVYKSTDVVVLLSNIGSYTVGPVFADVTADIQGVADKAFLDGEEITLVRDTNNKSNAQVIYSVGVPNWTFNVLVTGTELKLKVYSLPSALIAQDELVVPSNYQRPLILTLATELAPMFGVEPTQMLLLNQRQAVEMLKRSNVTPLYAKNDLPVGIGRYECD
ncbi:MULTISPECIES: hypothetical protein [Acinetobacter]|uniref:hypothetical protein n=1 Tax=Acinetobacter TaxID=469 RepID=UPI000DE75AC3|nr:hypothetical protein [Acinetobacter baumannii]MDH2644762.1 hypothetical protein [Acinetobacter baumannii]SSQ07956.1 Uncharacterised protein [Acinetobacter baumannii]